MRYFNFYNQGYFLLMAWRLLGFGSIHMDTGLTALMQVTGNLWRDLSHCSNLKSVATWLEMWQMGFGCFYYYPLLIPFFASDLLAKNMSALVNNALSFFIIVGLFHARKGRSKMKDHALCLASSQGRKMSTLIHMQFYGENKCLFADLEWMSQVIFRSNFRYGL